jgi:hypothetical protein
LKIAGKGCKRSAVLDCRQRHRNRRSDCCLSGVQMPNAARRGQAVALGDNVRRKAVMGWGASRRSTPGGGPGHHAGQDRRGDKHGGRARPRIARPPRRVAQAAADGHRHRALEHLLPSRPQGRLVADARLVQLRTLAPDRRPGHPGCHFLAEPHDRDIVPMNSALRANPRLTGTDRPVAAAGPGCIPSRALSRAGRAAWFGSGSGLTGVAHRQLVELARSLPARVAGRSKGDHAGPPLSGPAAASVRTLARFSVRRACIPSVSMQEWPTGF